MNSYRPKSTIASPSKTIFAVLGFLDEYTARFILKDGELVEHFYVNEKERANIFEDYLTRLVEELNLSTEIRRKVEEEHTNFYSKELTQVIDSYYWSNKLIGLKSDGTAAYTEGVGFGGLISDAVFPSGDLEAKWSFLIGAHQRYGWQNSFKFANAWHKVQLVSQLLKELGSTKVVIIYPNPDYVPSVSYVAFEPTAEIIKRLGLQLAGYSNG
jgi:hypothetical protein